MEPIIFTHQGIEIDARLVAKGLRADPEALRATLRKASVARTIEKDDGSEVGRVRVTFHPTRRRLPLLFTAKGVILQMSSADCSRRPRTPAGPDLSPSHR